jgi:hypothetical protein
VTPPPVQPMVISLDGLLTNQDLLTAVALRVRRSGGAWTPGVDGVVGHDLSPADCRELAIELATKVRDGSHEPGALRQLFRRRGLKARVFKVPPFRDRVLQTALLHGMEQHVARQFAPGSYGVRGSDAKLAVSDVVAFLDAEVHPEHHDGQVHLVKTDVSRFFDSISHARLQKLIRGTFRGRRMNRFIAATLRQGQSRPGFGLAQGAPLSPLLANMYLTGVDWFFEQRPTLFSSRYVDDILLIVPGDIERARANLLELERQVHRLGLRLNKNKTFVVSATEGVDFLGFRLRLGAQGVDVTPNERSVARLKKRLDEVPDGGNTTASLHAAKAAWAAYFSDLSPQAWAIGDCLVADEVAARLLRRPVAETPVETPRTTQ